jgi:hypothetical protein
MESWGWYCCFVLLATTLWVFFLRDHSFHFLALAMFFPSVFAFLFLLFDPTCEISLVEFLQTSFHFDFHVFACCIGGMLLEATLVAMTVVISLVCGWSCKAKVSSNAIHKHNQQYFLAYLRAAGEELGWRCFLLPLLLQQNKSLLRATLITGMVSLCIFILFLLIFTSLPGVVWGLYHLPIMILQTHKLKTKKRISHYSLSMPLMCCSLNIIHLCYLTRWLLSFPTITNAFLLESTKSHSHWFFFFFLLISSHFTPQVRCIQIQMGILKANNG